MSTRPSYHTVCLTTRCHNPFTVISDQLLTLNKAILDKLALHYSENSGVSEEMLTHTCYLCQHTNAPYFKQMPLFLKLFGWCKRSQAWLLCFSKARNLHVALPHHSLLVHELAPRTWWFVWNACSKLCYRFGFWQECFPVLDQLKKKKKRFFL